MEKNSNRGSRSFSTPRGLRRRDMLLFNNIEDSQLLEYEALVLPEVTAASVL